MKKIVSGILIVAFAFLAGFGGGMLSQQYKGNGVTIDAFGTKVEVGKNKVVPPANNVTINVSDEATIAEAIAEKALPSVVGITTVYESRYNSSSLFDDFFGFGFGGGFGGGAYDAEGVGTGFIVDDAGYILTNSHVIHDGTYKKVLVSLYDGEEIEGDVLWNDATLDLAVVKIEADGLVAVESVIQMN